MPFPNADTQFQPGNPGGPGRPRLKTILDFARDRVEAPGDDGRCIGDEIVDHWVGMIRERGSSGAAALRELLARLYGRTAVKVEAEVSIEHHDSDLPAILAALGYERRAAEAAAGPVESGRTGGGGLAGEVDAGPPPRAVEPEAAGCLRWEDRPAPDHDAPAAWEERADLAVLPGLVPGEVPG